MDEIGGKSRRQRAHCSLDSDDVSNVEHLPPGHLPPPKYTVVDICPLIVTLAGSPIPNFTDSPKR